MVNFYKYLGKLMKKSLLALTILGTFAGTTSAQSSVTIYGIIDASIASIDNGGAGRATRLDTGNNAASRIGFKGVEDLGNGLKAEFLLENGFDADDGEQAGGGGAGGFSRLAYVGLNGGFGTVRLGRQNSQIKEALGPIDPFGSSGITNSVNYYNGGGIPERVSNQITWNSNNYGGFSGRVGYRFGEVEDDTSARQGYGAQLGYANGPLNVQFGYDNQNSTTSTAVIDNGDTENLLLGATYDFGAFKLHGAYGQKKVDANPTTGADDFKVKSGMIGATLPFGASTIRAEYVRNNDDRDERDTNVIALGYSYAMSKRTQLYATYLRIDNDDNAVLGIPTAVAGETADGFAIGIQHNF